MAVYVREAHADDGAASFGNARVGIHVLQPKSFEERSKVANTCHAKLEISMPLVVDTIDDRVGHAYSGMPDRLYLVDQNGKVAFKSGRGPFGFQPPELEQSLVMVLLDQKMKESKASAR